MDEDKIKKKVWNIDLVVEDIKKFPQSYGTILGGKVENKTITTILRKKVSRLCATGILCKTSIIGTVFGRAIFFVIPKKYHIVIEAGRMGSKAFCFFKYEKNKKYIVVEDCWELEEYEWKKIKKKVFFEGNILKWV